MCIYTTRVSTRSERASNDQRVGPGPHIAIASGKAAFIVFFWESEREGCLAALDNIASQYRVSS